MKVGITGTREGLTEAQKIRMNSLGEAAITVLHHGDCIGVDAYSHSMARHSHIRVEVHPPSDNRERAHSQLGPSDVEHPPKPYLARNHDIVDASDVLVAFPKGYSEELRSGTWATVRYARKQKVPVVIVWPSGDLKGPRSCLSALFGSVYCA